MKRLHDGEVSGCSRPRTRKDASSTRVKSEKLCKEFNVPGLG
jgi:hypothetical protein